MGEHLDILLPYLGSLGLRLDLIGVALLGWDLIRVQRNMKMQASADAERLNEISSEFGGVAAWLEDLKRSADFRLSDGRNRYDDFDRGLAERAFSEISDASMATQQHLERLATLIVDQVQGAVRTNTSSLKCSHAGMILIILGFTLQLASSLMI